MTGAVSFWVPGAPVSQGSMRAFPGRGRRGGRPVVVADNGPALKAWRGSVAFHARHAWAGAAPLDAPVGVQLEFFLPRPSSVKRWLPSVKPDLDKLVRAVLDGLTDAGVYADDGRVVRLEASKAYADPALSRPGVSVAVYELRGVLA